MHAVQQNEYKQNSSAKNNAPDVKQLQQGQDLQFENTDSIQLEKIQDLANNSNAVKQLMSIQSYSDKSSKVLKATSLGELHQLKSKGENSELSPTKGSEVAQLEGGSPTSSSPLSGAASAVSSVAAFAGEKSSLIKDKDGKDAYSNKTIATQVAGSATGALDAYSDGNEIAEQVDVAMSPDQVESDLETTKTTLGTLSSLDFDQLGDINVVSEYFTVIETLDIFGVTNALKSAASFLFAKKEKAKIGVLKGQKEKAASVSDFPGELLEVASYALKKVSRSFYTAMARGILEAVRAITRWVTLLSGAFAAPVTEIINLVALVIDKGEKAYRMIKGIWKFFKGSKGAARKANAEKVFNLVASGNSHAIAFLKDYYASQFTFIQKKAIALLEEKTGAKEQLGDAVSQGMEFLFKQLKAKESHPEVKFIKNMIVDNIATQFKSKPPSAASTLFQVVLEQSAVQQGLSDAFAEVAS
jgi:hypothetical protein